MSVVDKQKEHRERMELMVTNYLSKPPNAMYDLGVGPKTEWKQLKNHYPRMQLYGCEPNKVLFKRLYPSFPGQLVKIGIDETAGIKDFYMPLDAKQASVFPLKGSSKQTTPMWTLDEFDKWAGSPKRILLWMDIEGSELAALKGGTELLKSGRVVAINLEVRDKSNHEGWPTATEIREYLATWDYKLVKEYNDQKTHRDVIYKKVKR